MVLNCALWRKENLAEKIIETAKTTKQKFDYPTQDLFNLVIENNWKRLPQEYNSMPVAHKNEQNYDAKIYHFCLEKANEVFANKHEIYWRYARKTPYYEMLLAGLWKTEIKRSISYRFIDKLLRRIKKICPF